MSLLVVGGRGPVGSGIVASLAATGHDVRATSREPASAPRIPRVTWTRVPSDATGIAAAALGGIERLFLLAPTGIVDQHAFMSAWIAAAKLAGVGRVVMMTAHEPDDTDDAPFRRAEADLIVSGIAGAILRPSWFMQNFHTYWGEGIRRDGVIALPAGEGRIPFIDARDIADVAVQLLLDSSTGCRTLILTGPEALSHADVAGIIAACTQRDVRYRDVSDEEFRSRLIADGMPADYAELVVAMFPVVRSGRAAATTRQVEEVLGRPARSFRDYARDYRSALS